MLLRTRLAVSTAAATAAWKCSPDEDEYLDRVVEDLP